MLLFQRNNAFFTIMNYMAMSWDKNPCLGGYEICNFVRTILGHYINYILGLSDPFLGVKKKILREIHKFYMFYPKILSFFQTYLLGILINFFYEIYLQIMQIKNILNPFIHNRDFKY